jgi:hypothetical protein
MMKSILRTLVRLNAITKFSQESLAEALLPHVRPGQIQFLGQYLDDVAYFMKKNAGAPPRCVECDTELSEYRPAARYCSAKCRQRAYRKRA